MLSDSCPIYVVILMSILNLDCCALISSVHQLYLFVVGSAHDGCM